MWWNPPSNNSTRLLRIVLPLHPLSQLPFFNFSDQDNRTSGKSEHPPASSYPQSSKPCSLPPPHTFTGYQCTDPNPLPPPCNCIFQSPNHRLPPFPLSSPSSLLSSLLSLLSFLSLLYTSLSSASIVAIIPSSNTSLKNNSLIQILPERWYVKSLPLPYL